jgi:hypothetical protein
MMKQEYRYLVTLLRFYWQDMPALRELAEILQREVDGRLVEISRLIESGDALSSRGLIARTDGDGAHAAGQHSDYTVDGVMELERLRREHQTEARRLTRERRLLEHELVDYATLSTVTSAVLKLIPADLRTVLEKLHRDRQHISDLPLTCDPTTLAYHLDYAYSRINLYVRPRLTRESLPFLSQHHPGIFPQSSGRTPRFRRSEVVLS